tara:strand:- start:58 stop:219 length:162 start_codon:yes stop_codon:yes gene_type:complete
MKHLPEQIDIDDASRAWESRQGPDPTDSNNINIVSPSDDVRQWMEDELENELY